MSGLKERTRRFWVSTLFLLLGPTTLCLTCLALFWQKAPVASRILNERLSSQTPFNVQLGAYRRIRPNVELLTRVVASKKGTSQASFFCPEVYRISQADSSVFMSFVQSFDERRTYDENVQEESVGAEFSESRELSTDEQTNASDDETFRKYSDDARRLANKFDLFVVPRVYCRDSKLDELKALTTSASSAFGVQENRAYCFVVQELVCQTDAEFETSARSCESNKEPLRNNELRSIFRTAALLNPKGESSDPDKSLDREVLAFASERPTLENIRALFVQTRDYSRLEALFELQKIACPRPYCLSWTRNADGTSFVEYDSRGVPTPMSLVAKFLPNLRRLGDESYFLGNLRSSTDRNFQEEVFSSALNVVSDASQNANVWTTEFEAFNLRNFQIDELCAELSLPGFTGRLVDLTIDQGAIRQGVFLGSGSVTIKNCAVPTRVLQGLIARKTLEINPRSATALRFVNDATPFQEFVVKFKLLPSGVVVDSSYENKVIACYKHQDVSYGLFLSKSQAGVPIPYSEPISALVESQDVKTFWTPLVRDALNHLPISEKAPRNADASDSLLR